MKEIFLILAALTGAPQPAPSFRAPISTDTAAAIFAEIISGSEAPAHDFNGDGALNIADFCGICHRAQINATAPEVTADAATVEAIAAELYPDEMHSYFYYEFDHINGDLCRKYEITADEITTTRIYFEFEDWSETRAAIINPYTETITIL